MSGLGVESCHASLTVDFTTLNWEALSEIICFGFARVAMNLLRHNRNCYIPRLSLNNT